MQKPVSHTDIQTQERKQLLDSLLDLACAMINTGGEVNYVEATLRDLGRAYGAREMNQFIVTSNIIVTMVYPDEDSYTQSRRLTKAVAVDFFKLEKLNALVQACLENPLPTDTLTQRMNDIIKTPSSRLFMLIGSVLAAGCFSIFFGGGMIEGAVAAAFALVICALQLYVKPLCPNDIVFNFFCALLCSFGICGAAYLLPGLNRDMVIVGDIMLLIPGIPLTNSLRDMLAGDTITGTMRFIESLIMAGALAVGFAVAPWVVGL